MMIVSRPSPINKMLLIVLGLFFLVQTLLKVGQGVSLEYFLGLSPLMVSKGHIYQFFTFPLFQNGVMSFLFNALLIWLIGSDLERQWGARTYGDFLFFSVLGSGIIYYLLSFIPYFSGLKATPLMGISGACYSLLLAYAIIFGERILLFMLIFPMKAKYFCLLIIGLECFMGLLTPQGASSLGHLAAMVSGFAYMRYKAYVLYSQRVGKNKRSSGRKGRGKLRLVKSEEEEDEPKYWQ